MKDFAFHRITSVACFVVRSVEIQLCRMTLFNYTVATRRLCVGLWTHAMWSVAFWRVVVAFH